MIHWFIVPNWQHSAVQHQVLPSDQSVYESRSLQTITVSSSLKTVRSRFQEKEPSIKKLFTGTCWKSRKSGVLNLSRSWATLIPYYRLPGYRVINHDSLLKMLQTFAKIKMAVFWVVSCCLIEVYRRFRNAYCIHHHGDDTARTSETSVNIPHTTIRYNPEGSHFHTRRRENLKSHNKSISST
jgi:hypothetical protein